MVIAVNIISIEDGLDQSDWDGWKKLNLEIGANIQVVGDDLTVTNIKHLNRAIDEKSMADHNFKATIISMILGFTCLALFLDGTLRLLGIIPPFLDIDISIIDKVAEKVETEVIPLLNQAKGYIPKI